MLEKAAIAGRLEEELVPEKGSQRAGVGLAHRYLAGMRRAYS